MKGREILKNKIKNVEKSDFDQLALDIYSYQFANNEFYKSFCTTLKGQGFRPKSIKEIPFLPVSFFKNNRIISGQYTPSIVYRSSATTGSIQSEHYVVDNEFYLENALNTFEGFYGKISDWLILALLPGYLERGDSSLISMSQYFISKSQNTQSGFYLTDHDALLKTINESKAENILLLGVSFALMELANIQNDLSNVIVMETGGMKGRGKEMPKKAFHEYLKKAFNIEKVHSEYGMTELLSQAYSKGNGLFYPASTMKVICKDLTDPLESVDYEKSGVINVIDLMNLDSCSFIETQDLGRSFENGSFELLGRVDASEIRGCNLLVSEI